MLELLSATAGALFPPEPPPALELPDEPAELEWLPEVEPPVSPFPPSEAEQAERLTAQIVERRA